MCVCVFGGGGGGGGCRGAETITTDRRTAGFAAGCSTPSCLAVTVLQQNDVRTDAVADVC